jgi:hypothetical protein
LRRVGLSKLGDEHGGSVRGRDVEEEEVARARGVEGEEKGFISIWEKVRALQKEEGGISAVGKRARREKAEVIAERRKGERDRLVTLV